MNPPLFAIDNLQPADFLHVYTDGKYGRKIQAITGSVGTHDALVINRQTVGESTVMPPWAHLTDLRHYEDKMRAGRVKVSILRIPDISPSARWAIAEAWVRDVKGTPYDFRGIRQMYTSRSKVWLKDAALEALPDGDAGYAHLKEKVLGWEWAHWCTEGLRTACLKGSNGQIDPLAKENPTPRTVENRVRDGRLVDVSEQCLTFAGREYRLIIPQEAD